MYEDLVKNPMTKPAANPTEVMEIGRRYAKGQSPEQISAEMNIDLKCVASFQPASTQAEAEDTVPPVEKASARRRK